MKYDSCHMYDISKIDSIDPNFEVAIGNRPSGLKEISCQQPGIPDSERWEYDTTEGINSIVNDVSIKSKILSLEHFFGNKRSFVVGFSL